MVKFYFADAFIKLTSRRELKNFIAYIFKEEGKKLLSLVFVFCDDKYLLAINKQFLQHSDYTDIITFTLSEAGRPIQGEIYISLERVVENAGKYAVKPVHELHRVIFHGVLHLCGYMDKSPNEKKTMTAGENKYLDQYFRMLNS